MSRTSYSANGEYKIHENFVNDLKEDVSQNSRTITERPNFVCPPEFILDNKCVFDLFCPLGFNEVNNKCIKEIGTNEELKSVCPPEFILDNKCVFNLSCPPGFNKVNNKCIKEMEPTK